ncbi:MAG: fibrobacter succinogenes major paralogous domain-containing protein [Alistipes sp.]|nr:fibrobacter succinogenes major paralogous domain-containing protein [Alistipes senegalensis]MCM1250034.1 fibrobacter succinogenes major paralogous domain-containing protein [Alistipes sp.]
MLYAPASGYRTLTTGGLTAVGTGGWYWSSSPYAASHVNAGDLGLNSGNVNPLNSDGRAHGLSVRCVQHLQAAFFG